jgi:hypothetical protein
MSLVHEALEIAGIVLRHREWHRREQHASCLHPVVLRALKAGHRPRAMSTLVLQWPHQADTDRSRLAYTQTERKGISNLQTVTTLGKYLRQHFDTLEDHHIRDMVALHTTGGVEIYDTTEQIVDVVQNGPRSCMKWEDYEVDDLGHHPYEVYCPSLGWRIAVRFNEAGRIDGRALLLEHNGQRIFVRSFKRCPDEGYSHSDEKLEAWLKDAGWEHEYEWPDGARLKRISISRGAGFLCPYLDGNTQTVNDHGDHIYIYRRGEYRATETDGTAEGERIECADCEDSYPESDRDDGIYVGYHSNRWVCSCCMNGYTYVLGRNGSRYYVRDEDHVEAEDGTDLHDGYLSDNGYVSIDNGDVYPESDTFTCDYDGCVYHVDDAVTCAESGDFIHRSNSWTCAESGNVYSDDVSYELVDGKSVHPDHLPEEDEDETETEASAAVPV